MNKSLLSQTLLIVFSASAVYAGPRKIAFMRPAFAPNGRGYTIWAADLDGSHAKKIASGVDPEISPDGMRIAFNTEGHVMDPSGDKRQIEIADVATGKVNVLKDIPSENCHRPVWSPDGKQIAFRIKADKRWQIGIVNADGSGFRLLKNAELEPDPSGPVWGRDGKSIFCHVPDRIYQIDLDGRIVNNWWLSNILTDSNMNSNECFSISPDGKSLLMNVALNAEHQPKGWDPPNAIEKFDFGAEKAVRIPRKEDFVWDPFWLSNDEFLCVIVKKNVTSIYRMSIDGKTAKLVIKDARVPSVSAP